MNVTENARHLLHVTVGLFAYRPIHRAITSKIGLI